MLDTETATKLMSRGKREWINLNEIQEPKKPQRAFMDQEQLEELSMSIKENGLIQAIGVNRTPDGLETIWGHRRLLALRMIGLVNTEAIVFENLIEWEVRLLRIVENLHQAKPLTIEQEDFLYSSYLLFKETYVTPHEAGKDNTGAAHEARDEGKAAFAKSIGAYQQKIYTAIAHAKLREDNLQYPEIQNALPSDLQETNRIAQWPDERRKLLKSKQDENGIIGGRNLRYAVYGVEAAPDEFKAEMADRIVNGEIDPLKSKDVGKALHDLPDDLKEPLLEGKITPKIAKNLSKIKERESREQFLKEDVAIKEEQKREIEQHEKEIETLKEENKKKRGEKRKLTAEQIKESVERAKYDNWMVDRWYDIHVDVLASARTDHLGEVSDPKKREQCYNYIQKVKDLCELVLHEKEEGEVDDIVEIEA